MNRLLLLPVLLLACTGLFGLEVQRGKLKLVINERTGRYSLFGTEDAAKPVWTPLFVTDDPTTSKWKIQVGDKTSVLGDDSAFTTLTETTSTGAKVVWTSKALVATLNFDFVLSAGSTLADGLKLSLSVINVSDSAIKVGVRWVLDTNLGEKKDHFRLATGETVNVETRWDTKLPDSVVSAAVGDDLPGLLVMAGKGPSVPSRLYVMNWRRVDEAPWEPPFKQGRDFNLLPYSFNDSALVFVFDAADVAPAASRDVSVVIGLRSAKSFDGSRIGSANPIDDLLKKNQDPTLSALDQDLISLQTLVTQIDAKLADPTRVTTEDLRLLQAVLDQIEARKKTLEAAKP